ncbi:MAG: hypothetical protein AAF628_20150 [Planctomycetota bacterium]
MTVRYRRRRLVVDKQLQSRIVAAVSWPAAVCVAVTAILLGLFCARITEQALIAEVQLDGLLTMLTTSLGFMVVATIYFLFNTLKISHRVVGPTVRICETLRQVRDGDPTVRAHVRKKDFLLEMAAELNEFLDWAEPYLPSTSVAEREDADEEDEVAQIATAPQVEAAATQEPPAPFAEAAPADETGDQHDGSKPASRPAAANSSSVTEEDLLFG